MKKVARKDTVFLEGAHVSCAFTHLSRFFGKANCEKSRITLLKNGLKSLDISTWPSEVTMGFLSRKIPNSPDFYPGKIKSHFRPFPTKCLSFLSVFKLHYFL